MVCNVVIGLQQIQQQEQAPIETLTNVSEPCEHVARAAQSNQQKLSAQLHQMQIIMQAVKLQYAAATQPIYQILWRK